MKKLSLVLTLFALLIASCSNNEKPAFDYDDQDINDAIRLDAYAQIDDKLIINISSDNSFFNSHIKKEQILVVPKVRKEEGQAITFKDLLDNRIDDFSFVQNSNQEISITLDEFSASTYYVYFEKEASKDNMLSYASVFTTSVNDQPFLTIMGEKQKYYGGESSPKFVINYKDAAIENNNLITFDGAFNQLEVSTIDADENKISFETTGMIDNDERGIINFNAGFFKDIDYDVHVSYDVYFSYAYLDQKTFAFNKNEFSFDVITVEKEFVNPLRKDNVTIDETLEALTVKSVIRKNAHTASIALTVSDNSLNDLQKVLEYINRSKIGFNNSLDGFNVAFSLDFAVDYPSLIILPLFDYANHSLSITAKGYNLKDIEFKQDDINYTSSNIVLGTNLSLLNFESIHNGFIANYKVLDDTKHFYGKVTFDESKIQTQWNSNYLLSSYFDTNALTMSLRNEEKNLDDILNNPVVIDSDLKGVHLDASLSAYDFDIGLGKYGPALSSLTEFLKLSRIVDYIDGSQFDCLNGYHRLFEDDVYKQLQSIDDFAEALNDADAYATYNTDKIMYKERQDRWGVFYHQYIVRMQEMIREYEDKFIAKLIELSQTPSFTYRLVTLDDWDDEGNLGVSLMHPTDPYFSIEDYDIDDMYLVEFKYYYFSSAISEYNKSKKFTIDVERLLKEDFARRFSSLVGVTNDMVYSSLLGYIFLNIATQEDAKEFNDLYLGFANEMAQDFEESIITDFYRNITSFYNFQNEAKVHLRRFLADMKLKLELFGSFAQILNLFSLSSPDYVTMRDAIRGADLAITSYDYIKPLKADENYVYAVNSIVKSKMVKADYEVSYDEHGNINSSFGFFDAENGERLDDLNSDSIVNEDNYKVIYNRYLALKEMGIEDTNNFLAYLLKWQVFGFDACERYANYRYQSAYDMGETLLDYPLPILANFEAPYAPNNGDSYINYCAETYEGSGQYFSENQNYYYGSSGNQLLGSKRNWMAKEIRGTILDADHMSFDTVTLNGYATYNETVWNHTKDEHHLFKMFEKGMCSYALYRVY